MMQHVKRWTAVTLVVGAALGLMASAASAAQNVANTSQKGSLLVFPLIDVREGQTTTIRLANDTSVDVWVKCYYVNETKARNDFLFLLTRKQAVSWDARTGAADPIGAVNSFPTHIGPFPGNPNLGELVCFAVNDAGSAQISHNHLSGTATVGSAEAVPAPGNESEIIQRQSFEYTAWAFTARGVVRGAQVGAPGRLVLSGLAGEYDACPLYNIAHISPTLAIGPGVVATHRISVSTCAQDLRQDFEIHITKLRLDVWNAQEVKFTGAWECSNSVESFLLTEADVLPGNFSRERLGTSAAHVNIQGIASTQCDLPGISSENVGLVAVVDRVGVITDGGEIPWHGTTTNTAGQHPRAGFVLWDPDLESAPESAGR